MKGFNSDGPSSVRVTSARDETCYAFVSERQLSGTWGSEKNGRMGRKAVQGIPGDRGDVLKNVPLRKYRVATISTPRIW
jgi:hypothetical protein